MLELAHIFEVTVPIVQAMMVSVMADLVWRGLSDLPVHEKIFDCTVGADLTHRVVFREGFFGTPLELINFIVSTWRYQGDFAFGKWDHECKA